MFACCSANRSPILELPAMNFCTQRETQPVSLETRDLVVKSSTQASKQRSTRPENICGEGRVVSVQLANGLREYSGDVEFGLRRWSGIGWRGLTPMNSFICLRSMRAWNSRCSAAVRLLLGGQYWQIDAKPARSLGDYFRKSKLRTRP